MNLHFLQLPEAFSGLLCCFSFPVHRKYFVLHTQQPRQPEKQGKTNENQLKFNDYAVCIVATAFSTLQWRRKSKVVGQLFV